MADLMFKRGLQSALPAKGQDGCFYLTTDTNRLYVGQGNNNAPVLLNQTVQVVNSLSDLPASPPAADNDFYYVKDKNILAVYDSSSGNASKWVQINPNTNDTIKVTGASFDAGLKGADNTVTYKLTLQQAKTDIGGTETALGDISADLVLTSELISGIVPEAAEVGLGAAASGDGVKVATEGDGSDSTKFITLMPGDNMSISVKNGVITFAAEDTTYTHEVVLGEGNAVTTVLAGSDSSKNAIAYKAGLDLEVTGDASADSITFKHKTYNFNGKTIANDSDLTHGGKFNVVSEIKASNGHVTEVVTKELSLPADTSIAKIESAATSQASRPDAGKELFPNGWCRKITETDGSTHDVDFTAEADQLVDHFNEEIVNKIAAANSAMTYKGTVATVAALNAKTKVEVGDVWLFNDNDGDYKAGDMAIAIDKTGAVTAGEIASGNVQWERIPSGDELNTDTLFKGVVTAGTNQVTYGIAPVSESGVTSVTGNKDLTLAVEQDLTLTTANNVSTIKHATITTEAPAASEADSRDAFTAITGITVSNGHITKIEKKTFTPDDYSISASGNKIVLANTNGINDEIAVSGDKWIGLTAAADQITAAHNDAQEAVVTADQASNTELTHGGSFKTISGVYYDAKGHITKIATQNLTLPTDNNTTYDLAVVAADGGANAAAAHNTANPYLRLKGSDGSAYAAQLVGSGSLSVVGSANKVSINMVWGEF